MMKVKGAALPTHWIQWQWEGGQGGEGESPATAPWCARHTHDDARPGLWPGPGAAQLRAAAHLRRARRKLRCGEVHVGHEVEAARPVACGGGVRGGVKEGEGGL